MARKGPTHTSPPDPQLWQSRRGNEKEKEQKDLSSPSWFSRKILHPTWGSELWLLQEIEHFGVWNETVFATSVDCRKSRHRSVGFLRLSRGFTGQLEFSTSARRGTPWNKNWQHFYEHWYYQEIIGTFLVIQWLRLHSYSPVGSLVRELDPTCHN